MLVARRGKGLTVNEGGISTRGPIFQPFAVGQVGKSADRSLVDDEITLSNEMSLGAARFAHIAMIPSYWVIVPVCGSQRLT
jgi:hypothetical protein